jgi:hypothetical protein
MTALFIISLYILCVVSLAFLACWIVSPRRTRLHFGVGLQYIVENGVTKRRLFNRVYHGPIRWPWWRLVSFNLYKLPSVAFPSTGHSLWVYTRWGSMFFDFYFDRRMVRA